MKCINCYREINAGNKFCNYCGTMQPLDREAYEREHPELATAMTDEEIHRLAQTPVPHSHGTAVAPPQAPIVPDGAAHTISYQQEEPVEPQPQVPDDPGVEMMQCPECGKMVAANSSFCQYCGCQFVTPSAQIQEEGHMTAMPAAMPHHETNNYQPYVKPTKTGMSGWAKALLTLSIILLVGAIGGWVYYFFFYNKVEKLKPDVELVKFSRKGGDKTVTITTDAKEIEVAKKPDWVTVTVGDGEITIKCQQLETYEDREGVIKLTAGDKEAKITVKQSSKATYMRLSQDIIRTGYNGEEVVIDIDTDGDPATIEYDVENPVMCIISDKTTSGFTLNIENNESYSVRQGSITIRSGKLEKTIIIVQAKKCGYCDGTGKDLCSYCNGTGRKDCTYCTDGEVYEGYNYETGESIYSKCVECGGRGDKTCESCNGRGHNTCEECNGTGNKFSDD